MDINKDYYKIIDNSVSQNKTQILLTHTASTLEHHLLKITNRFNGKYTYLPHYTISLDGIIYQHLDPKSYTNYFSDEVINAQAIIIILENVGWLTRNIKQKDYYDWKGDNYYGNVIERLWRGKKYWAEYTEKQIKSLLSLLNYLCIECSIEKEFVGNNITIAKPKQFRGILNRANYNKIFFDLSPAMDFDAIKNGLI